jgi:hypothetical protein
MKKVLSIVMNAHLKRGILLNGILGVRLTVIMIARQKNGNLIDLEMSF